MKRCVFTSLGGRCILRAGHPNPHVRPSKPEPVVREAAPLDLDDESDAMLERRERRDDELRREEAT